MTNVNAPKRVTAQDVADASGVSRSTVSFVLNKTPGQTIPDRTRTAVLEAAARLGYVPNASAQILAGGRSRFVVMSLGELPFADIVNVFEQTTADDLVRHGYIPVIAHSGGPSDTEPLLTLSAALRPAAVITTSPLSERDRKILARNGNPRLLHTFNSPEALFELFTRTGRAQAQHLAELGHAEICFIGSAEPTLAHFVAARARGAEQGSAEAGIGYSGALNWTGDLDSLSTSLAGLLAENPRTTAVVAYNDHVALAVIAAARRLGREVPSQLAVVGADNLPLGELVSPSLSTATFEVTSALGGTFSELIASEVEVQPTIEVSVSVIAREST